MEFSGIFINEATEILKTNKCFWHPNLHGTCTCKLPVSNHHCPECDFCMACGGLDLPMLFDGISSYLEKSIAETMERVKKMNETVTYLYGKPNG